MFFRKNNKDIILDDKVIKKSKVPILINDKGWKQTFGTKMNRNMESLSKQLQKLIIEENETKRRIKEISARKNTLIKMILKLSEYINTKGRDDALEELEKTKEEMKEINEEINELYIKLEDYPYEIEKINLSLLKETIKVAYGELNKQKNQLFETEEEISKLRSKLDILRESKEELENNIDYLYSFLHTMVGHEEMESLDQQFEDDN